jgi:hypothetical protein
MVDEPETPACESRAASWSVYAASRQFLAGTCGGRRLLRPLRRLGKPFRRFRRTTTEDDEPAFQTQIRRTARVASACQSGLPRGRLGQDWASATA